MSHKELDPEVEAAIKVLEKHLRFVIQWRDPTIEGLASEWHSRYELGCIIGKDHAYEIMEEVKKQYLPTSQWRLLPQNEADRYQQGVEAGQRLAKLGYKTKVKS